MLLLPLSLEKYYRRSTRFSLLLSVVELATGPLYTTGAEAIQENILNCNEGIFECPLRLDCTLVNDERGGDIGRWGIRMKIEFLWLANRTTRPRHAHTFRK